MYVKNRMKIRNLEELVSHIEPISIERKITYSKNQHIRTYVFSF